MLASESSLRVYLMGRFHSKVIYQKCVFFTEYWKPLLVKRKLVKNNKKIIMHQKLCIDYESNKSMLKILFLKKFRRAHHTSCS